MWKMQQSVALLTLRTSHYSLVIFSFPSSHWACSFFIGLFSSWAHFFHSRSFLYLVPFGLFFNMGTYPIKTGCSVQYGIYFLLTTLIHLHKVEEIWPRISQLLILKFSEIYWYILSSSKPINMQFSTTKNSKDSYLCIHISSPSAS